MLVQVEIAHGTLNMAGLAASVAEPLAQGGVLSVLTSEDCPKLRELPGESTDSLPVRAQALDGTALRMTGLLVGG